MPISLKTLLKGQLRFMSSNGFEVIAVSSREIELNEVHEQEGVRIIPIEMSRRISPLKDLISLLRFFRLCIIEKPHIVHTHTPKAGIIGMLASKLAGVPIRLHTVAGLPLMESHGIKRIILNWVEILTYKFSTKVYPNSFVLYEFITSHNYVSSEKLKVLGSGSSNGIDTAYFNRNQVSLKERKKLRSLLGIRQGDFVYIFIGRLVKDKGINELVTAFTNIQSFQSDAFLLLVGAEEPKLDPLTNDTLSRIESNPRIISLGFRSDVRPYLAISNALVFPSYREGFPNVVMQAGAMGLPSIVTDINGCNEIILNGENGIIIPPKNVVALESAMLNLMRDRLLYSGLQLRSRTMITSRFEQSQMWEIILNEYNELLKKRRVNV